MIGGKLENGDVLVEVELEKTYNIAPQVRPGQEFVARLNSGGLSYGGYSPYAIPGTASRRLYPPWNKTGPDGSGNYKYDLNNVFMPKKVIGLQLPTTRTGTPGKYYSATMNISTYVTAMPGAFDYVNAPPARMNLYASNGTEAQDVLIARSDDIKPPKAGNSTWPFHPGKRDSQVILNPVAAMPVGKVYFRFEIEHDYDWTANKTIYLPSNYYGSGNPLPPQLGFWDVEFGTSALYEEDVTAQSWVSPTGSVTKYDWKKERVTTVAAGIRAVVPIPDDALMRTKGGRFSFYTDQATAFTVTMTGGSTSYTSPSQTGPGWVRLTNIPATVFSASTVTVTVNATSMEKPQLYANIPWTDTDGYNYYSYEDLVGSVSEISIGRYDSAISTCNVTLRDDSGIDVNDKFAPGKRLRIRSNTSPGVYESDYHGVAACLASTVFVGSIHNRTATYPNGARPEIKVLATNHYSVLLEKKGYAFKSLENYDRMLPYLGLTTIVDASITFPKSNDPNQSITGFDDYNGLWRLKDDSNNMTVLDALMLTRNSQFGYVWFDRFNRINCKSTPPSRTIVFNDLNPGPGEFSYSSIDLHYGTDNIINYINLTAYEHVTSVGDDLLISNNITKEELAISSPESVRKNRKAEYKLEMFKNVSYEDVETKILDKYKDPVITANTLRLPVKTIEDLALVSRFDVYETITVKYQDKLDDAYRIHSVKHSIKPGETWITELGFGLSHDSVLW